MTLICCIDDAMGMAFNGRRQSRDSALCRDIAAMAAGQPISMDPRSETLFEGMNILPGGEKAPWLFLELAPPSSLGLKPEGLVLYRWNRLYPADTYFDLPLDGCRLLEKREFSGSSHEKITKEVYLCEAE